MQFILQQHMVGINSLGNVKESAIEKPLIVHEKQLNEIARSLDNIVANQRIIQAKYDSLSDGMDNINRQVLYMRKRTSK